MTHFRTIFFSVLATIVVTYFTDNLPEFVRVRSTFDAIQRQLFFAPDYVRRQWSVYDVQTAAEILSTPEIETLSFENLLQIIWHESGWNQYARNRNANGTTDLGLTQQNSRYAPARCVELWGTGCTSGDIFSVEINLRLFVYFLRYCERESILQTLTCYNSPKNSRSGRYDYARLVLNTYVY